MKLTPTNANVAALIITVLGCLQLAGQLTGSRALRGLGAAVGFAPFPKVFSDVDGLETFASSFTLRWRDVTGREGQVRAHAGDAPEVLAAFRNTALTVIRWLGYKVVERFEHFRGFRLVAVGAARAESRMTEPSR